MEKPRFAYRLLAAALICALTLGAAAPLVLCAPAAASHASEQAPSHGDSPAPCDAPCCAMQQAPGSEEAPAPPLAERRTTQLDALPAPTGPFSAGALSFGALLFDGTMSFPGRRLVYAPATRAHGPPPALPVRLHVLHAAFLR